MSDEELLKAKKSLIAMALENAKEKAETVAETLNVKLGPPKNVTVVSFSPFYPIYRSMAMKEETSTQLEPKELKLSMNVEVVFGIN